LANRYRNAAGEIDIVSVHRKVLHAVEVKERRTINEARFAIGTRQQARITNALDIFLQERNEIYDAVQIDAIFVTSKELRFLENAWFPEVMSA
jgi:Holliday junction resolvase-like predicted endonuclease